MKNDVSKIEGGKELWNHNIPKRVDDLRSHAIFLTNKFSRFFSSNNADATLTVLKGNPNGKFGLPFSSQDRY